MPPLWKGGFAYTELGPPLPPTMFNRLAGLGFTQTELRLLLVAFAAQESFQGISGMYPSADSRVLVALVEPQKVVCLPASSKSVPPTATLNGVEAIPLTARPCTAVDCVVKSSQPAEPLSPAETITEMPCAAACSQTAL